MLHRSKPKVLIVGCGFGGLHAAKELADTKADVIVIDKTNHHLFQPLLYQVASAALSPGEIATPLRAILKDDKNIQVMMAEATSIDLNNRVVTLRTGEIDYDYLILAPGANNSYFGKNQWAEYAPGLKSLKDALQIRERILLSFEKAERYYHTPDVTKYLTFVIVGGGPTGVEVSGAIAEIGRKTMLPDYPLLKPEDIKVYLVEAGDRILPTFPQELADYSAKALTKLGVQIMTKTRVTDVTGKGVAIGDNFIETTNIIWAAGNEACSILKTLGVPQDRTGRVIVNQDCSIPGHPEAFVIGDSAFLKQPNGQVVPGVAQGAIQEGIYVAKIITDKIPPEQRKPFEYRDKGSLATIGAAKAIADFGKMKFKGFFAWIVWAVVHIFFLIGFRNRIRVMLEWIWYYITFQPGSRLIVYNTMKKEEKVEQNTGS